MILSQRLLLVVLTLAIVNANAENDSNLLIPTFIDKTSHQTFVHQYTGGWEFFVGGGVAAFDCNDDNAVDLYVAGGDSPAILLVNQFNDYLKNHPRNQDLRFLPKKHKNTDLKQVIGAYPIDIDGDKILDLAVLRVGENVLLKGEGDCNFHRANEEWGFDGGNKWTTAFSATWEKNRNGPTLVFGNYVDRTKEDGPFGTCDTHTLWRFSQEGFDEPIILKPGFCSLSMLFSDWQHGGRADLRVSNDRHYYLYKGEEQLWDIKEKPHLYTEDEGWQSFRIWGMGIASRDITGDGLPDYLLTSMSDQKFQVLAVNKKSADGTLLPYYQDQAYQRGLTAHRPYFGNEGRPSTAWHAQFGDVNNDGLDDLFIAKGNVEQMPVAAMQDPNNLLLQVKGSKFREYGRQAGIANTEKSRGAALADFNNDGKLDLVVVNRNHHFKIYQNNTAFSKDSGHWLTLELRQNNSNTQAIGAWIELLVENADGHLQTYHREITIGGGHASGFVGVNHFGLGRAVVGVKFQITWPDGEKSNWRTAKINQQIIVNRQLYMNKND